MARRAGQGMLARPSHKNNRTQPFSNFSAWSCASCVGLPPFSLITNQTASSSPAQVLKECQTYSSRQNIGRATVLDYREDNDFQDLQAPLRLQLLKAAEQIGRIGALRQRHLRQLPARQRRQCAHRARLACSVLELVQTQISLLGANISRAQMQHLASQPCHLPLSLTSCSVMLKAAAHLSQGRRQAALASPDGRNGSGTRAGPAGRAKVAGLLWNRLHTL